MSEFIDFKKLLPKAIEKYQVTRQTRAAQICKRFRDIAPGIIGDDARESIDAKYFRRGSLVVRVPSSVWAQRVHVHRHDLIMKLNLELGEDVVKDVRAVVEGA